MRRIVFASLFIGLAWLSSLAEGQQDKKPDQKTDKKPAAEPAYLEVRLPANAALALDGYQTRQRGPVRFFTTPPLAPGYKYTYELVATWPGPDGKPIKESKNVTLNPGETKRVQFGPPEKEKSKDENWIKLFNGKDLTGWKATGKMEVWGAEKGVIFCQGGGGGWLMTEKEYGDFELRLEYKMPKGGNSGVGIRSPLQGDPAYVGMEIQLIDDVNWGKLESWQHTGSIYNVVPAAKIANKEIGEWNDMRIVAKGRRILVEQNGTKLVDANLDDYVKEHAKRHPGILREKGHIGFQSYNKRVEFRNIRLRELR